MFLTWCMIGNRSAVVSLWKFFNYVSVDGTLRHGHGGLGASLWPRSQNDDWRTSAVTLKSTSWRSKPRPRGVTPLAKVLQLGTRSSLLCSRALLMHTG